jgi:hypothetical protein
VFARIGNYRHTLSFRFILGITLPLLLLFTLGCKSQKNNRQELLEAELRTREQELSAAQAELSSVRGIQQMQMSGQVIPGNPTGQSCLKDLSLGLGTGGYDGDGVPGDEGLQVIVVPKDNDGSAVKAAGRLSIAAFDVSREGAKIPIGLWEIPPEQLRAYWQTGLFNSGYKLALQWHQPPMNNKVRVVARMQTFDGRMFETDKDVNVKPMP